MFDYEGSGADDPAVELEQSLDALLAADWDAHAKAIVIEPEVEVWMWGAEVHLREVVDWQSTSGIREWLEARGFGFKDQGKPERPKEALEAVFRHARIARSSAQYQALARRLSFPRCQDAAFIRLGAALSGWFREGA